MAATQQKINWSKQIKALEKYVKSKKWTVRYTTKAKNDWADWENKRISLKKRANLEVLFYVFLHELGHMLLLQNGRAYSSKYEVVFNEFAGGTQPINITRIEEELDAWRSGVRLAKRLKLKIDRRNYEKVKSKYAMTYITWACRKIVGRSEEFAQIAAEVYQQSQKSSPNEDLPANENNNTTDQN